MPEKHKLPRGYHITSIDEDTGTFGNIDATGKGWSALHNASPDMVKQFVEAMTPPPPTSDVTGIGVNCAVAIIRALNLDEAKFPGIKLTDEVADWVIAAMQFHEDNWAKQRDEMKRLNQALMAERVPDDFFRVLTELKADCHPSMIDGLNRLENTFKKSAGGQG